VGLNAADRRIFLAGLLATWNERDYQYVRRRERGRPLDRAEIKAILAWRRREAMLLDQPERGLALAYLRGWKP
jgi:hypothetical protein